MTGAAGFSRRQQGLLAAAVTVLVAAWLVMDAAGGLLRDMSPGPCREGEVAEAQWWPSGPSGTELAGTVTGWIVFDRSTEGLPADPARCVPTLEVAGSSTGGTGPAPSGELPVRSALTVATWWLATDLLAFTPAYVTVLWLVLGWHRRRYRRPTGPVTGLAALAAQARAAAARPELPWLALGAGLADGTENVLLLLRVFRWREIGQGPLGLVTADDLGLGPAHWVGGLKLVLVAGPVLAALVALAARLLPGVPALPRVLRRQWVQALVAVVFALALLVPEQSADALRRMSTAQWLGALLLMALFSLVLALTSNGVLKPLTDPAPVPPGPESSARPGTAGARPGGLARVLGAVLARVVGAVPWRALWSGFVVTVAGGALLGLGLVGPWQGLRVPGALVGLVGAVSMAIDWAEARSPGRTTGATAPTPLDPAAFERLQRRRALAAAVTAAVIPAAVAVTTVRAGATDVLFLRPGGARQGELWLRLALGLVLLAAVPGAAFLLRELARAAREWPARRRGLLLAVIVAVHAPAFTFHDPDVTVGQAHRLGSLSVLVIYLSGFCLLGSITDTVSLALARPTALRPYVVPGALRALGIRRPPLMGLLAAWVALSPFGGSLQGYHAVSLSPQKLPPPVSSGELISRWAGWRSLAEADDGGGGDEPLPVLVVAASGGGIRAAYWTAAVVDCVVERVAMGDELCAEPASSEQRAEVRERRSRFLLASGVSGGSLGLASYVSAVGSDWAQPATAEPLEAGWYRHRLGDDYLAPVVASLLFNDGFNSLLRPRQGIDRAAVLERAWTASWPERELARPWLTGQATGAPPLVFLNGYSVNDGCRVVVSPLVTNGERRATNCRAPSAGGDTLLDATIDAGDLLCQDLSAATAALTSARFPFISPSGRVEPDCRAGEGEAVETVDGGYRETSGASTVVEAWPRLAGELAAVTGRCVLPVFVQIDNGYQSDEVAPAGSTGQLLAPLIGLTNTATGYEAAARSASHRLFDNWYTVTTRAHPGSQAPLGWVLSSDAKADLEDQLALNGDEIGAIRALLSGTELDGTPLGPAAATCPASEGQAQ